MEWAFRIWKETMGEYDGDSNNNNVDREPPINANAPHNMYNTYTLV